MNIATLLQEQARERPQAPAFIDRRGAVTFAELERAAGQTATLLSANGLRPGDAVLVCHPMSPELYVALAAIFRLGLVAMFLDLSGRRESVERCCALHPPKGLIAPSGTHLLRLFSPALRRIPRKFSIGLPVPGAVRLDGVKRLLPFSAIEPVAADTPALLTFTSGSTGEPKAVPRTHGFLLAQHRLLVRHLELKSGETDLATLPIFVLANLASGVTSLLPDADLRRPGSVAAAPVIRQIETHRVVRGAASPAFFERLADYCEARALRLTRMEKMFTGGGPVSPALLERLQHIAPGAAITAVYGSSEAEPITHVAWRDTTPEDRISMLAGKGLLVGAPIPEIELRILRHQWGRSIGPYTREEFERECLEHGTPGEIVVSGPHVVPGYLNRNGDSETKFDVAGCRWHRTGDAGYLDGYGRLWLLGRTSALLSDARGALFPFSVECAAAGQPGVRRSALVLHRGRRVLAVEASGRFDLDGLRSRVAWAELDAVVEVKRIPVDKRHNAKVDYPALAKVVERTLVNEQGR